MKVLLISGYFPPGNLTGSEKRTLGYALELKRRGYEVQVVCAGSFDRGERYWNGFTDENYQDISVRRVYLNWSLAPDPNRYLYDNPLIQRYLTAWLQEWQVDIVHIVSSYTLSASVIWAAKENGLPVLLTLTDFWFVCPKLSLLKSDGRLCHGITTGRECLECMMWDTSIRQRLKKVLTGRQSISVLDWASKHPSVSKNRGLRGWALNMDDRKARLSAAIQAVDYIIAPSEGLALEIRSAGINLPIQVIRSGHDLRWLADAPEKTASDLIRFSYIGQIDPTKGVHLVVSAFATSPWNAHAQLKIYGDLNKSRAYTEQLMNMAQENGANIDFCGAFPYERVGEVFAGIDILVVPSLWYENNPRVIQEAFACKTPVIATQVSGIAEFVQPEINGLLFERGNSGDLARQMRRVVEEQGLLDTLRKGVPRVKTIDEEMEEVVEIYSNLKFDRGA